MSAKLTNAQAYPAGAPQPIGYLQRSAWADAQRKHGLRQVECPGCHLWMFPQQLADGERCFVCAALTPAEDDKAQSGMGG